MAKKFDVAAVVKESLGDVRVSEVDIVRTIPAAEILPNPKNFYELSDLDDLAASIEQNGLIDPLIVKRMEDGRYMILSGHRRFAAMTEILGKTEISCLIRQPVSDVFEELMLIEANRTQRKMSAADLSKQAERYTDLLVQLKEAGVAIPGRLRDRVAEALQVSSTKLARLHAIRENLVPELLARFDAGEINESKAYEISKTPEGFQTTLVPKEKWYVDQLNIGIAAEMWESAQRRKAEEPEPEPKAEAPKPVDPTGTSWDAEAYLKQRQEEDDKYREALEYHARQFIGTLEQCYERREGIDRLKECFGRLYAGHSSFDAPSYKSSPKGLEISFSDLGLRYVTRTWTEVYDMLSIIALHGVAALDEDESVSESNTKPAGLEWHRTAPDCMPPEIAPYGSAILLWGDGGLSRTPDSLVKMTINAMPETARWWAVVEGPEEEKT